MKKLKDLKENECIKVNTLKEAEYFIKKCGFKQVLPHQILYKYILYIRKTGGFCWYDKAENFNVYLASEFIKPKKSTKKIIKELTKRVDALEKIVVPDILTASVVQAVHNADVVMKASQPKAELEIGKWYKLSGEGNEALLHLLKYPNKAYGFDNLGIWRNESDVWGFHQYDFIQATHKEVEEALINEAKNRGFKDGVVFKRLGNGKEAFCDGEIYWHDNYGCPALFYGGIAIMQNGKWAEIISQPEQEEEIDWSVKGKLYQSHGGIVVMSTGEHEDSLFVGVTLKDTSEYGLYRSAQWLKSLFKPFKGYICLKND